MGPFTRGSGNRPRVPKQWALSGEQPAVGTGEQRGAEALACHQRPSRLELDPRYLPEPPLGAAELTSGGRSSPYEMNLPGSDAMGRVWVALVLCLLDLIESNDPPCEDLWYSKSRTCQPVSQLMPYPLACDSG